jgi:hypothetical protein
MIEVRPNIRGARGQSTLVPASASMKKTTGLLCVLSVPHKCPSTESRRARVRRGSRRDRITCAYGKLAGAASAAHVMMREMG